jgi:[acyl-carrier-protein] S-malonyltransferase
MESARHGLKKVLDEATFRDARFPVYPNVTGEPVQDGGELRELVYRQLTSPVLWEQTIRNMIRDGIDRFTELGPGRVLQGLVARTDRSVTVDGIDTWNGRTGVPA